MPEKTPAEFPSGPKITSDDTTKVVSVRIACGSFAKVQTARVRQRLQPVRFQNLGVDIRMAEVDNPQFTRARRESGENPRTVKLSRNSNESPLVRLEMIGSIDATQARAGYTFRLLYEQMMGGQRSPSFLQERVDGGEAPDTFTEGRARASRQLRRISEELNEADYDVLRFVCGEGRGMRELAAYRSVRPGTAKAALIGALDRLADVLGLGKPKGRDG